MSDSDSDADAREAAMRRRLTIEKYSQPGSRVYTDENDHNPLVLEKCPDCKGTGRDSGFVLDVFLYYSHTCPTCKGERFSGELVPQFANDAEPLDATVSIYGGVRCPGCRGVFTINSPQSWSGRRHLLCGQKILLHKKAPK